MKSLQDSRQVMGYWRSGTDRHRVVPQHLDHRYGPFQVPSAGQGLGPSHHCVDRVAGLLRGGDRSPLGVVRGAPESGRHTAAPELEARRALLTVWWRSDIGAVPAGPPLRRPRLSPLIRFWPKFPPTRFLPVTPVLHSPPPGILGEELIERSAVHIESHTPPNERRPCHEYK